MLLLGGTALSERGLRAASRISVATGARLLAETFPARLERGAGVPGVDRLAYLAEQAEAQLAGVDNLILAGARSPVSFFAYPDRASDLVADPAAQSPPWPNPTRTPQPPSSYSRTRSRPAPSRSSPRPRRRRRPSRAR